jgi:hypothetical protein
VTGDSNKTIVLRTKVETIKRTKKGKTQGQGRVTTRINDFQWRGKEERLQLMAILKCPECNMPTLGRWFKCNPRQIVAFREGGRVNLSDRRWKRNRS